MKKKIIIPIIYLILCLIISFHRIPFWDEARAWLISQNCNVLEFLDMMKLECHLFVWYLIIYPFSKLNIFYPYSIYIVNSLIAFFAILILWQKSPFNTLQKTLITFSVPFLLLWGVVARCYSIGILFLFLALSFYKIRFKKPYTYLIFLCLSMNTSVMSFIGGFFLILIFLFENFKKKDFFKFLSIFILCNLIVAIQILSFSPDYLRQMPEMTFLRDFIWYVFSPLVFIKGYEFQSVLMTLLRLSAIVMAVYFSIFAFKNNKKLLFFIYPTYFSMVILFTFFYSGNFWHYFYFYFYFIVAIWMLKEENKTPFKFDVVFGLILALFLFKGALFIDSRLTTINDSKSVYIAEEILKNYKDKKLFCLDPWSDIVPASVPYLSKVTIYDKNNQDRKTYKSLRNQINFNLDLFDADDFAKYVDKNSVLLTTTAFLNHELNNPQRIYDDKTGIVKFIGKNNTVSFIPYKKREDIKLWSYLIKVNN